VEKLSLIKCFGAQRMTKLHYDITPSTDGKYITLTVAGEISRNNAMQCNTEAHSFGKELGVNRYLMDLIQARNTDSVLNNYEFAYSDMRESKGIDMNARVALLVDPEDHSHDFIEIVSRNAGLNDRIFTCKKTAIKYLLED
jgi:hypothetical protein